MPFYGFRRNSFLFSAFRWRKAAKATRPIPMPASERLKAASGDYSRVCKQTVPAAVAFSLPSAFPPSEPSRESPCGVKNKAHVAETYLSLSYPLPPTAAPPIRTLTENDVRRLLVLLAPKVQGKKRMKTAVSKDTHIGAKNQHPGQKKGAARAGERNKKSGRLFQVVRCGSGGRTRTSDLRVMSPTSCQLLYPAMYR